MIEAILCELESIEGGRRDAKWMNIRESDNQRGMSSSMMAAALSKSCVYLKGSYDECDTVLTRDLLLLFSYLGKAAESCCNLARSQKVDLALGDNVDSCLRPFSRCVDPSFLERFAYVRNIAARDILENGHLKSFLAILASFRNEPLVELASNIPTATGSVVSVHRESERMRILFRLNESISSIVLAEGEELAFFFGKQLHQAIARMWISNGSLLFQRSCSSEQPSMEFKETSLPMNKILPEMASGSGNLTIMKRPGLQQLWQHPLRELVGFVYDYDLLQRIPDVLSELAVMSGSKLDFSSWITRFALLRVVTRAGEFFKSMHPAGVLRGSCKNARDLIEKIREKLGHLSKAMLEMLKNAENRSIFDQVFEELQSLRGRLLQEREEWDEKLVEHSAEAVWEEVQRNDYESDSGKDSSWKGLKALLKLVEAPSGDLNSKDAVEFIDEIRSMLRVDTDILKEKGEQALKDVLRRELSVVVCELNQCCTDLREAMVMEAKKLKESLKAWCALNRHSIKQQSQNLNTELSARFLKFLFLLDDLVASEDVTADGDVIKDFWKFLSTAAETGMYQREKLVDILHEVTGLANVIDLLLVVVMVKNTLDSSIELRDLLLSETADEEFLQLNVDGLVEQLKTVRSTIMGVHETRGKLDISTFLHQFKEINRLLSRHQSAHRSTCNLHFVRALHITKDVNCSENVAKTIPFANWNPSNLNMNVAKDAMKELENMKSNVTFGQELMAKSNTYLAALEDKRMDLALSFAACKLSWLRNSISDTAARAKAIELEKQEFKNAILRSHTPIGEEAKYYLQFAFRMLREHEEKSVIQAHEFILYSAHQSLKWMSNSAVQLGNEFTHPWSSSSSIEDNRDLILIAKVRDAKSFEEVDTQLLLKHPVTRQMWTLVEHVKLILQD